MPVNESEVMLDPENLLLLFPGVPGRCLFFIHYLG